MQAIIHTHASHASALAATGQPLRTIHMDGAKRPPTSRCSSSAARMQLAAMAAGGFKEVAPALAEEACRFLRQPAIVRATFDYWARTLGR